MKILIDARTLGTKPSGIGMYLYHFAIAMAEEGRNQLVLVTDKKESEQILTLENQWRVPVHVYGEKVERSLSVWRYGHYLQKLINELKPDIFWEVNNLLPVRIKVPGGKYLITIHDVFPVTMPEQFGKIYPYYFHYGLGKTLRYCDGILYNSEDTRRQAEMYFPTARVKKNYLGYIAVPPVEPGKEGRKDYFFYVGNLERRKGTDILLKAYAQYLEKGGDRELYLAGKIREESIAREIEAMKKTLDRMHYLGYLTNEERDAHYRECGCFLFPSRAEGFGIPVVEALSCGADVIASDLPIFREIVGDAVTYFPITEDNSVSCLAETMLHFVPSGEAEREKKRFAATRYTAGALLPGMLDFLEEITAKE